MSTGEGTGRGSNANVGQALSTKPRDAYAWKGPMAGLVGNIALAEANAGAAAGLA